jgi:GAF domain-containing protein
MAASPHRNPTFDDGCAFDGRWCTAWHTEIGSLQDSAFSATDVAAFRQMTNQLAVAYANAETYSQSQRLARNKVQANEIIAHMQQQADVNAILHVTAQELGKALGAKRARIRLGLDVPSPSGD